MIRLVHGRLPRALTVSSLPLSFRLLHPHPRHVSSSASASPAPKSAVSQGFRKKAGWALEVAVGWAPKSAHTSLYPSGLDLKAYPLSAHAEYREGETAENEAVDQAEEKRWEAEEAYVAFRRAMARDLPRSSLGPHPFADPEKEWRGMGRGKGTGEDAYGIFLPRPGSLVPPTTVHPAIDEDPKLLPKDKAALEAYRLKRMAEVLNPMKGQRTAPGSRLVLEEGEHARFMVCDGVGGWNDSGVDPALFSHRLVYHSFLRSTSAASAPPLDVLQKAYKDVLADPVVTAGSSTACLLDIDAKGLMRTLNLGDSGFMIFRSGRIQHDEPSQTHYFNCPLQLSKMPDGAHREGEGPEDGNQDNFQLRRGDLILLFTDGFSDNVSTAETSFLVQRMHSYAGLQGLADGLIRVARQRMFDRECRSPFTVGAAKAGYHAPGGKLDDVVLLAIECLGAPE